MCPELWFFCVLIQNWLFVNCLLEGKIENAPCLTKILCNFFPRAIAQRLDYRSHLLTFISGTSSKSFYLFGRQTYSQFSWMMPSVQGLRDSAGPWLRPSTRWLVPVPAICSSITSHAATTSVSSSWFIKDLMVADTPPYAIMLGCFVFLETKFRSTFSDGHKSS